MFTECGLVPERGDGDGESPRRYAAVDEVLYVTVIRTRRGTVGKRFSARCHG